MLVEGKDEMQEPARKFADRVIILAIARASMVLALPTIGLFFWLYTGWQDDKLDAIRTQVTSVQMTSLSASQKASDVSERLIVVETEQKEDAASSSQFQSEMLGRLDRMQDAIVGLSNSVSALTATVQALAENQRRDRRRPP